MRSAEEIYESNRAKFHDWGTLKDMCLASMKEYAAQALKEAAERAKIKNKTTSSFPHEIMGKEVDKQSILEIINELT